MSNRSKKEYIEKIRFFYKGSTKQQKRAILDDCCRVCGYNRKYAIRVLNTESNGYSNKVAKRGRKRRYDDPMLLEVLRDIWVAGNLPCGKRLKYFIPKWMPKYDKFIIEEDIKNKLLTISPATIDRLLLPQRRKFQKLGLSTTKPGSILKKHIPIKTNQWNETQPGFLEVDSVAHCGNTTAGTYVNTINCVDIATGWTEQRAVWGKGERAVVEAIKDVERSLPFALKGFDCDNGSEFLNWHLKRYLIDRKQPISFTRSRAYHKNDNAHIENKNWTHVRLYIGYQRFEHPELTQKLNDLYTSEWNLFFNFCLVTQ